MTQRETKIIVKAIHDIMQDDGDFHGGIAALCRLAGLHYPADRILKGTRRADFRKLASGPNQAFIAREKPQR